MTETIALSLFALALFGVRMRSKTRVNRSKEQQDSGEFVVVSIQKEKHHEGILELARHTFSGHDWIVGDYDSWFQKDAHCIAIGLENRTRGDLAALFVMKANKQDRTGTLQGLRVHPQYRGKGLAHIMQNEMIAQMQKRRQEFGIDALLYTAYDTNYGSIKVAEKSGMKLINATPFMFMAESEDSSLPELITRNGKGTLEGFYAEAKAHVGKSPILKKRTFRQVKSPQKAFEQLEKLGTTMLYQDWKPYKVAPYNLDKILKKNDCFELDEGEGGLSIGICRPDDNGMICILNVYWWLNDKGGKGRSAVLDVLAHMDHWADICRKNKVTSLYLSYSEPAHAGLVDLKVVTKQIPQRELIFQLNL